jgi:uncharacterized protein YjbI with pentapeptide repeats
VAVAVEVLDRWKGEVPARAALHSSNSGSACGLFGRPPPIGERVLALAYPSRGDPGTFTVGACSGAVYRMPDAVPAPLAKLGAERERFDAAVAASPGSLAPVFERARFRESWDPAGAAAEYLAIAQNFPDLPAAHLGTGRALLAAGRVEEALPPLRRALGLAPADAEAAGLIGQARLRLGDRTALAALRHFQGFEGKDLDLAGRELRGATLAGARIGVLRAAGADLRGALFRGARIGGPQWAPSPLPPGASPRTDFRDTDLRGADFTGTVITAANCHRAKLDGANLERAKFQGATMVEASLRRVAGAGASFRFADLSRASLAQAGLPGADFGRARLLGTDLREARLAGADFDFADLVGADLRGAEIHGATFFGAFYNCRTRFPRGFDPDERGMARLPEGCSDR